MTIFNNNTLKTITIIITASLYSLGISGQDNSKYNWWNPAKNNFPAIEGQAWPEEVAATYDRLPARAEKTVQSNVWNLSHQSAGLSIRFRTSAKEIIVRYTVTGDLAMQHMPATGVSGVDLYAIDPNGAWKWAAGRYNFGDTITYRFSALSDEAREYRLYLPLYNKVKWMELGVPDHDSIVPLQKRKEKPIVVYGTSIAQGGCASRPGLAWTSLLDRQMDRQVINLGFSGNGKLEPPVTALVSEIDAKIFVLDCLPNISGLPPAEIQERIITAVTTLRKKRPVTPILLVEHATPSMQMINTIGDGNYVTANKALQDAYEKLQSTGTKKLYILPASQINFDLSATVDGVHPADVGMVAYAKAYESSLRIILNEPMGNINTTMPCRQYRELSFYDWDARHNEILTMNSVQAPKVLLIGNSITHFWGGLPAAPLARGADSWKEVLDPLGTRNLGFGYDRVENVLWRVYHDELDGYQASKIYIMIGTNNLGINTDEEIVAGLKLLVTAIRQRQPQAGILLSGILPRTNMEKRIVRINQLIMQMAGEQQVQFINPGTVLLKADATIDASLFTDGLHPNGTGYSKLAHFLQPYLK
ncbi:Lysophospholipase L1 [Chitinophaga sp. CF118]|uniref:SGNH/GDSL hydrolase family protein n=1 Tax=Chitinophaga sp. CF118 TaxID=1884367 RepID=UPI0008E098F9|nr:SGNH/GDSL hydrolase family protein [Chitinophaga sp. CF118]SFD09627.1 Lysophospholipase L1 [Chitinophaga sp. CF118]